MDGEINEKKIEKRKETEKERESTGGMLCVKAAGLDLRMEN